MAFLTLPLYLHVLFFRGFSLFRSIIGPTAFSQDKFASRQLNRDVNWRRRSGWTAHQLTETINLVNSVSSLEWGGVQTSEHELWMEM